METIQIDNEVFAHLQKNARPFVDTPNSTLRRLLEIDKNLVTSDENIIKTQKDKENLDDLIAEGMTFRRTKAPKADLKVLVKNGMLQNGQKLYLIDYQGNKVEGKSASISNNRLLYESQTFSMSDLARFLLKSIGFKSNSVRGPAHWKTDTGETIEALWSQHLNSN